MSARKKRGSFSAAMGSARPPKIPPRESASRQLHELLSQVQTKVCAIEMENALLREALEPFARMADGKDGWRDDGGCAVFPAMTLVRAARRALEGTRG